MKLFECVLINRLPANKKVFTFFKISDKRFVPEPFGEKDMRDGHGQSTVLTRFDGEPLISLTCRGRQSGFYDGNRCLVDNVSPDLRIIRNLAVGRQRISPPKQNIVCIQNVVLSIAPNCLGVIRAEFFRFRTQGTMGDVVG